MLKARRANGTCPVGCLCLVCVYAEEAPAYNTTFVVYSCLGQERMPCFRIPRTAWWTNGISASKRGMSATLGETHKKTISLSPRLPAIALGDGWRNERGQELRERAEDQNHFF